MRCKGVGKRVEILKNKLRTLSFGHFGLILVMLLRSQPYDFDVIAHIGPLYGLERLHKSFFKWFFFWPLWTNFGYVSQIPVKQF